MRATTTTRFIIGDAFPASDPVAEFVTHLAMMSNDTLRLLSRVPFRGGYYFDAPELRVVSLRVQAALQHEVAETIRATQTSSGEVRVFLSSLPLAARTDLELVIRREPDGFSPPDRAGPRLGEIRAYGGDVAGALAAVAEMEGTITARGPDDILRFDFADEIAERVLPEDDLVLVTRLHDDALAIARLARAAVNEYVRRRRRHA
jgi:hypothetical protein